MQINTNYSPNFSGAFRIKPDEQTAKAKIPTLFTKHRQFFYNIKEEGDMFVVLRDKADKKFLDFIKDNKIAGVEYYPEINTSSGLDDEQPELLRKLLNSKDFNKSFSSIKQIEAGMKQSENITKLSNIINAMCLNIEEPKVTFAKDCTTVRDDIKKRTLYIISPQPSTYFVYLRPDDVNMYESRRCIIDSKGRIVKEYNGPDCVTFDKRFIRSKSALCNTLI